MIWRCV